MILLWCDSFLSISGTLSITMDDIFMLFQVQFWQETHQSYYSLQALLVTKYFALVEEKIIYLRKFWLPWHNSPIKMLGIEYFKPNEKNLKINNNKLEQNIDERFISFNTLYVCPRKRSSSLQILFYILSYKFLKKFLIFSLVLLLLAKNKLKST